MSLLPQALAALRQASTQPQDEANVLVEERSPWQPESWLAQRCWQVLADAGAMPEALRVAGLLGTRQPLAPLQALYRVALRSSSQPELIPLVQRELSRRVLGAFIAPAETLQIDSLLHIAASAATIHNLPLACASLERIDQLPKVWARIIARSEMRTLLAETIAQVGLHPLTTHLLAEAIRRYDDAGAQLLHQVTTLAAIPASFGQIYK